MHIPQKLPQFKGLFGVLAVCGAFEAHFYDISDGRVEEKSFIKHVPREEIIGKDEGLVGNSERAGNFGAVSAEGTREHNLRIQFQKEVASILTEAVRYRKTTHLYIFAPHAVGIQIRKYLDRETSNKIASIFNGEYIKENPVKILERFREDILV